MGLNITIETGLKEANFLDVTLCLNTNTYRPYRKPNNKPVYIHKQSNHPTCVKKQLPISINQRLNSISSNKQNFDNAKTEYEEALRTSGYKDKLQFIETINTNNNQQQKRNRPRRNITWYNPPWNSTTTTNLGKQFLNLIKKHFPSNHRWSKIINRNTVKLSYSCTPNIEKIIKSHNKKIISKQTHTENNEENCNCRAKESCPLNGKCLTSCIVYKAIITAPSEPTRQYFGSTEGPFKIRFNNHTHAFRNPTKKHATCLSTYIHDLQDKQIHPNLRWEIEKKCHPYKCGSRRCDLCLTEKLCLLKSKNTLNKRTELLSKCRHSTKFKLKATL